MAISQILKNKEPKKKTIMKRMLKFILGFIFFLSQFSSNIHAQQPRGYEITGRIEGLKDGEKVTAIVLNSSGWRMNRQDSTYAKNGVFHLEGMVPDGPREFWIEFERFAMHLVMNAGDKVTIQSNENLANFRHSYIDDYVTVTGAPYNHSMLALLPAWFFYDRCIINLKNYAQHLTDSLGFDGPALSGVFNSIEEVNHSFEMEVFNANPNQTEAALTKSYPFLGNQVNERSGHGSFMAAAYEQLTPALKNSFYGRQMKEYVKLSVGQPFPEFTLPTTEGQPLSLMEVVKKSKITLVHFWAVNSVIRKKMDDELRLAYEKYHAKGLSIIGVSSDKYADEWKDVVQQEKIPWYNVSDMKGKDGIVEHVYHEFGDPKTHNTTNVLIDANGKILAWDVSGVEMQWYLWKTLGQ